MKETILQRRRKHLKEMFRKKAIERLNFAIQRLYSLGAEIEREGILWKH